MALVAEQEILLMVLVRFCRIMSSRTYNSEDVLTPILILNYIHPPLSMMDIQLHPRRVERNGTDGNQEL